MRLMSSANDHKIVEAGFSFHAGAQRAVLKRTNNSDRHGSSHLIKGLL
jgi:hypothetical protein